MATGSIFPRDVGDGVEMKKAILEAKKLPHDNVRRSNGGNDLTSPPKSKKGKKARREPWYSEYESVRRSSNQISQVEVSQPERKAQAAGVERWLAEDDNVLEKLYHWDSPDKQPSKSQLDVHGISPSKTSGRKAGAFVVRTKATSSRLEREDAAGHKSNDPSVGGTDELATFACKDDSEDEPGSSLTRTESFRAQSKEDETTPAMYQAARGDNDPVYSEDGMKKAMQRAMQEQADTSDTHASQATLDSEHDGRKLIIEEVREQPDRSSMQTPSILAYAHNTRIYVGNLPRRTGHAELHKAFSRFGPIFEARVAADDSSGRRRRFGSVVYKSQASAKAAVATMSESELGGRTLRVSLWNETRIPRPANGLGGVLGGNVHRDGGEEEIAAMDMDVEGLAQGNAVPESNDTLTLGLGLAIDGPKIGQSKAIPNLASPQRDTIACSDIIQIQEHRGVTAESGGKDAAGTAAITKSEKLDDSDTETQSHDLTLPDLLVADGNVTGDPSGPWQSGRVTLSASGSNTPRNPNMPGADRNRGSEHDGDETLASNLLAQSSDPLWPGVDEPSPLPPQSPRFIDEITLLQHHAAYKSYLAQNFAHQNNKLKPSKKIQQLSMAQFMDLSTDVYDELVRRRESTGNVPKRLLPQDKFHTWRNEARQKISARPLKLFKQLATDVLDDLERRKPQFIEQDTERSSGVSSMLQDQHHTTWIAPTEAMLDPGRYRAMLLEHQGLGQDIHRETVESIASSNSMVDNNTESISRQVDDRVSTIPTSIMSSKHAANRTKHETKTSYAASVDDPGLDHDTSAKLVTMFVDEFLANLRETPGLLQQLGSPKSGSAPLIKEYARLKSTVASTSVETLAAGFVRYKRHEIDASVRSTAPTLPSQEGVPGWQDKIALLWAQDRPDRPDNVEHLTADDEADGVSPEPVQERDIRQAFSFLIASDEYQWLLNRTKLETIMSTTIPIYSNVRTQLLDALSMATTVVLSLHWSPRRFMEHQYDEPTDLGYVELMWPHAGLEMLELMAAAVACEDIRIEGTILNSHTVTITLGDEFTAVQLTGSAVVRLEVAEMLVWLGAACRATSIESTISTCIPKIRSFGDIMCDVTYVQALPPTGNHNTGLCWYQMFNNPVIVQGYPIPRRTPGEHGLEIALPMMATLGQAIDVVTFTSTTMLKGFSSMFVPTLLTATSIVWHFLLNSNGSRMSYNDGMDAATVSEPINFNTLKAARHFVGWTPIADQLTGSNKAGYAVGHSSAPPASPAFASISSASLSVSKIVGGSLSFARGKKDIPAAFRHSGDYLAKIESASEWIVVMYDVFSRRAWLSDGASVLLYICRSWLHSHKRRLQIYAKANEGDQSACEAVDLMDAIDRFRWPGELDGKTSAIYALYNNTNRNLKLSRTEEIKIETINGQSSNNVITTWTTWQTIVEEKFTSLEIVYDHIVRHRLCPTTDIKMPFRSGTFEGYEFNDLVSGTSTLQPHEAKLLSDADDWLKWCSESRMIHLMGSDFGELIRPATTSSHPGHLKCGRYTLCPTDLDYLVAPISILQPLNRNVRADSRQDNCITLGPACVWRDPVSSFHRCRCKQGTCEVAITRLNDNSSKRYQKSAQAFDHDTVWKEYALGAVIFGSQPNRLSKVKDNETERLAVPPRPRLRRSKGTISDNGVELGSSSSFDSMSLSSKETPPTSDSGIGLETPSSSTSSREPGNPPTTTTQPPIRHPASRAKDLGYRYVEQQAGAGA
ncbi:hypothetical protein LTR62_004152 [Meristemomyces frigidus]|uniref:RRM domain-containing protein n=1 Tax=Meristemomyces frigidus TaxID=1508187 RepID=A0AAN7TRQ1_9PEZI|nr:hypothetical protein LTR62_004152 [Meristemomyces frigidus]